MTTLTERRVWSTNPDRWVADAVSGQDYDPFGMVRPNRSASDDGYRFGFNGKEDDSEWEMQDYGMRIYDTRVAKFLSVDPLSSKYPYISPYPFAENMPIAAVDLDGLEALLAFSGGPSGGHEEANNDDLNGGHQTLGQYVSEVEKFAKENGITMKTKIIKSGFSLGAEEKKAFVDYVKENAGNGPIIIYGYSWGGDFAVEMAKALDTEGIKVNLLITVDASDGPLCGTTVDRDIPSNVVQNVNFYQTTNSPISSRGDVNTADDPSKTNVYNINMDNRVKGVDHGNIDEVVKPAAVAWSQSTLDGKKRPVTYDKPAGSGGSSRGSAGASYGSSSSSGSSSSGSSSYQQSSSGSSR